MELTPTCFGTYPTTPQGRAETVCCRCGYATQCIEYTGTLNQIQKDMGQYMKQATNTDTILAERGSRYGKFTGQAEVSQRLKGVVREFMIRRDCEVAPDQMEALEMICHKIARIINGDPDYHDSWADIAGYAKLVADRLETGVEK